MSQAFEDYLREVAQSPEDEFNAAMQEEEAPQLQAIDPNYAENNAMLMDAISEVIHDRDSNSNLPTIYDQQLLELIDAVTLE